MSEHDAEERALLDAYRQGRDRSRALEIPGVCESTAEGIGGEILTRDELVALTTCERLGRAHDARIAWLAELRVLPELEQDVEIAALERAVRAILRGRG
jgi:hypothetical protein